MYRPLEYVIFTSCNLCLLCRVILHCNVGWCVKGSAVHRSRQQFLVAEWLGLSVTIRVRVRAKAGECDFSILFFFFCVKSDKHLCLARSWKLQRSWCKTTKVCDVTMMYCKEWYMENVPIRAGVVIDYNCCLFTSPCCKF